MAPGAPKRRTVHHFTHNHPLTEFHNPAEFICDGCKTYGSGKTTYRCDPCNYHLHEYCATCPITLPTSIHPQHELTLVNQSTRQTERTCDICKESVEGLFYRCKLCEFDVHPLCTLGQVPGAGTGQKPSPSTGPSFSRVLVSVTVAVVCGIFGVPNLLDGGL